MDTDLLRTLRIFSTERSAQPPHAQAARLSVFVSTWKDSPDKDVPGVLAGNAERGARMVFEMPCPDKRFVFVASTLEDQQQADTEITSWASSHGYRKPSEDQVYTIFNKVTAVREYRLLERTYV